MLVFRVYFDAFFKPFSRLFILSLKIVDYTNSIIRSIIFRVDLYRLFVVFYGLIIIFLGLISNTNTIIGSSIIFISLCQFNQQLNLLIDILFSDSNDIVSIDIAIVLLFCFIGPLSSLFLVVLLQQFDEGYLLIRDIEIWLQFYYLFV